MSSTPSNARADMLQFLRSLVNNPRGVSAIAPSGESLARIMTREISVENGRVLELGPGTGVFTRALLARGIDEADLTLIEFGADFAKALQQRFPRAQVHRMDASQIARSDAFDDACFGAVVSGLPLLSMSPLAITGIVGGAFSLLGRGGALYQFTYGPRCPVPSDILDRLGLQAKRIGGTVRNLPPASVYRISRRADLSASVVRRNRCHRPVDADVAALAAELSARSRAIEAGSLDPRR